jgi:hypothetical protein
MRFREQMRDAWPEKEKQDGDTILAQISDGFGFLSTALIRLSIVVILLELCSS